METYKIGKMGKPHGVWGEIAFLYDDDVFDRVDADFLFVEIDGLPVPFLIDECRICSDELALVKFNGINDEDQAAELAGCAVLFPREIAERAHVDESAPVTKAELIGYEVLDAKDCKTIGHIKAVDDSTANILLEVSTSNGDILIPANEELIECFDRKNRGIIITIPDGLLTL